MNARIVAAEAGGGASFEYDTNDASRVDVVAKLRWQRLTRRNWRRRKLIR